MEVMRSFRTASSFSGSTQYFDLLRKLSCATCISVTASGDSYLPLGSGVGSLGAEWVLVTRASLGSRIKCQRGAPLGW